MSRISEKRKFRPEESSIKSQNLIEKFKERLHQDGFRGALGAVLLFVIRNIKSKLNFIAAIKSRRYQREVLALGSPKERFAAIYSKNLWGSQESGSGGGSELEYTKNLRVQFPAIVDKFGVRSIVDAPCGDFNWMRYILPELSVTYTGLDIVESVIEKNNELYSAKNISFSVADICSDSLPDCEMLMVRDCLFHLSYEDIDKFLRNIAVCDYKYLFTTSHLVGPKWQFNNTDIVTGDCRLIDLFSSPFSFNKDRILLSVDDYLEGYPPRIMALFEKDSVPEILAM